MEVTQYNKKELVIVGGGGLGRELESWFSQSYLINEYDLLGYLDDDKNSLNNLENNYKIIDRINQESLFNAKNILIAIASSKVKKYIYNTYKNKENFNILSFVHSSAIIGKHIKFGLGIVISPNVIISCNSQIKNCVFINCGSQIGHDVQIGNYTSIMASVNIGGGAIIGDNVFIGTGAVILPGVKICANVKIGAGAVALRNIKKEGTYFGNPAKKIF